MSTFPCPGCRVVYPWKPEYAGKKTLCKKCGIAMTVPDLTPPPPPSLFDELGSVTAAHRSPPPESKTPQPRLATGNALTLRESQASNAGLIRVQWAKYLECYWPEILLVKVIPIVCATIGVTLYAAANPGPIPLLVVPAVMLVILLGAVGYHLYQHKEQMWHGCICPAVVISQQPYLIAAATDLSMGVGSYPAVKIVKQPLGSMTGGPPEVGTRLATVAIYTWGDGSRWGSFFPMVINCVTTDTQAISAALESIPEDEWAMLLYGVRQLKGTPRAGKLILLR